MIFEYLSKYGITFERCLWSVMAVCAVAITLSIASYTPTRTDAEILVCAHAGKVWLPQTRECWSAPANAFTPAR